MLYLVVILSMMVGVAYITYILLANDSDTTTISPRLQNTSTTTSSSIDGTCGKICPKSTSIVVPLVGSTTVSTPIMGRIPQTSGYMGANPEFESNRPYTKEKCFQDAREMKTLFNSPEYANQRAAIASATGKPELENGFPTVFATFDELERHCMFSATCDGMEKCNDTMFWSIAV